MAEKIKKELFEDHMNFIKLVGAGGVRIFDYGPSGEGDDINLHRAKILEHLGYMKIEHITRGENVYAVPKLTEKGEEAYKQIK
ncbi:MAG: hypothetical protein V3S97_11015 [Candidatus Bathyarchaeia archaeon]